MTEVLQLAINLARNCGYAVFPCLDTKAPACPHGFKDAISGPDLIAALWQRHPGPLIGVATGQASGVSVLDVDRKHAQARAWWAANSSRLLPTRTYETRSGGLHLYFRHIEGITSTTGRICPGIDSRGARGYVIHWFAAGFACLDHTPPAPWPAWLLAELTQPRQPPGRPKHDPPPTGPDGPQAGLDALCRVVREGKEGDRNARLYWAAQRCREREMGEKAIETLLLPAARQSGLPDLEIRRTIQSAVRGPSR